MEYNRQNENENVGRERGDTGEKNCASHKFTQNEQNIFKYLFVVENENALVCTGTIHKT